LRDWYHQKITDQKAARKSERDREVELEKNNGTYFENAFGKKRSLPQTRQFMSWSSNMKRIYGEDLNRDRDSSEKVNPKKRTTTNLPKSKNTAIGEKSEYFLKNVERAFPKPENILPKTILKNTATSVRGMAIRSHGGSPLRSQNSIPARSQQDRPGGPRRYSSQGPKLDTTITEAKEKHRILKETNV
jgi:hypothetical protein